MVKTVLVLECTQRYNWYKIFENATLLSGEKIAVEQCTWSELHVVAYHDSGLVCTIMPSRKPLENTNQNKMRNGVKPDFILFRTLSQHINNLSHKNLLYAIQYSNIPTINSLQSIYGMLEKPWVFGELKKIQKKLGNDAFPLIDQTYYPNHKAMIISPGFPCVVKIGPFHAGYGKIKVESQPRWDDVRSIVAIHNDYCTAEMWIDWDWEVRIQKIGNNIKCFKRKSMNWKGNVGNQSINEDCKVEEEFKVMINEVSKIFGGLEICALDLVHDKKTNKYIILELNGTAIGLVKRHEINDMNLMRDLVIAKMNILYKKNSEKSEINGEINEEKEEIQDIKKDENSKMIENNEILKNNNLIDSDKKEIENAYINAVSKLRVLEKEKMELEKNLNENTKSNNGKKDCIVM